MDKIALVLDIERNFYNESLKIHFLTTIKEKNTLEYYARVLAQIKQYEEEKSKDISEFKLEEVKETLRSFNYKSRDSLNGVLSIIIRYIDFCIYNNYTNNCINCAKSISSSDLDDLIDNQGQINRYIYNELEISKIVYSCENPQDAVIFCLLWDGINGDDFSEIRYLKKTDCKLDGDKKFVKVTRRFTVPQIELSDIKDDYEIIDTNEDKFGVVYADIDRDVWLEVSDMTAEVIQEAIEQEAYLTVNLDSGNTDERYQDRPLADNEYVVRVAGVGKVNPVTRNVLNRRVKQNAILRNKPTLNPTTILFSGASHYAQKMAKTEGLQIPTPEIFKATCDRYGMTHHSWHRLSRIWKFIRDNQ